MKTGFFFIEIIIPKKNQTETGTFDTVKTFHATNTINQPYLLKY